MPLRTETNITVSDVYGRPLESLSTRLGRRQQFTDFRVIGMTEPGITFLTLDGEIKTHDPASTYRFGGPRLIVGTVPRRAFTFTETGDVRVPSPGEWYMDENGMTVQARPGAVYASPYMIVERAVVELPA
jgi:hypothetical protein